jgi:membrane-bound inhibitor of C-type lysozyme
MIGKLGAGALPFLTATVALAQASVPVSTVQYSCAQGKSLTAEYFDGPTRTAADGRPIPGGRVVVTLGDGKKLTLPQTLSGSGIRYADEGESFVFWSKGDTAFVEEGPKQTVTYDKCVGKKKKK